MNIKTDFNTKKAFYLVLIMFITFSSNITVAKTICSKNLTTNNDSPQLSTKLLNAMASFVDTNDFDPQKSFSLTSISERCLQVSDETQVSQNQADLLKSNALSNLEEGDTRTLIQKSQSGKRTWTHTFIQGQFVLTEYSLEPA